MILEFLTDYEEFPGQLPVRDISLIAIKYMKGRFFVDLLSLIPFNQFVKMQNGFDKLLYLFKVLRLEKGFEILNVGNIMSAVKIFYQRRLNDIILNNPYLADNTLVDNNRITELIQIGAFLKVMKLIITIFNLAILISSFLYIYYEIVDKVKQQQLNDMSYYD